MKVLVVDDQHSTRTELRRSIESLAWEAAEAATPEGALAQVSAFVPDVVVIDHASHGARGLETAAELRSSGFSGPILMFAALVDAKARARATSLGVRQVSRVDRRAVVRMLLALSQHAAHERN